MVEKASNTKISGGILIVDGNQYFNAVVNDHRKIALNSNSRVVKVKVLYDGDCECLPETVSLPNININEDTLHLISFGLHNNMTIKKIDLSHNFITDNKAVIISNCLKHNSTIQKLDLSHSNISINGMNILSNSIEHAIPLEYVDLSGNKSSPWGVYCAIIRHCCVNDLTLCGDEGMKDYAKEITDSLQRNTKLQLLTLCACRRKLVNYKDMVEKASNTKWPVGILIIDGNLCFNAVVNDHRKIALNSNSRVVKVKVLYDGDCECLPETVSLPNIDINEDTLQLITFGLHNNTTIEKIDLSHNFITDNKAVIISNCLKYNSTILRLDLSHNNISILME